MKRKLLPLLAGLLVVASVGHASSSLPPTAEQIYSNLNKCWQDGDFDALDAYHRQLIKEWPKYVPVQVMDATYRYRQGAQVEALLDGLKALQNRLRSCPTELPPAFADVLSAQIVRYERSLQWYEKQGITAQKRKNLYDPRKMPQDKRSKQWGFEMLIKTAPDLMLASAVEGTPHMVARKMQGHAQVEPGSLLRVLADKNLMSDARRQAGVQLSSVRTEQARQALLDGLSEPDWKLSQAAARSLSAHGEDAVDDLLSKLADESCSSSELRLAIWTLLKIGNNQPRILSALDDLANNTPHKSAADAARRTRSILGKK